MPGLLRLPPVQVESESGEIERRTVGRAYREWGTW